MNVFLTKTISMAGVVLAGIASMAFVGAAGVVSHICNRYDVERKEIQAEREEYIMQHPEEHAMYSKLEHMSDLTNENDKMRRETANLRYLVTRKDADIQELNAKIERLDRQNSNLKVKLAASRASEELDASDRNEAIKTVTDMISRTHDWETEKMAALNRLIDKL